MGYETYLVELLRPLGVYDLSTGTINREELSVYGTLLDQGETHLEETERETCLLTAEDFGLERVEELLPYRPVSDTIDLRRAALAALLRIGGDSFTLEAINDTLAGCGVNAKARETGTPNYVQVYFPDVPGEPENIDQLKAIIEEILPCQLGIEYLFWNLTWSEAQERFASWSEIAELGLSWVQTRLYVQ
jgi:hypothetical protein